MRISLVVVIGFLLIASVVLAQNDYVGKVENLDFDEGRGVVFDIVVYNPEGKEVFRQGRGVSPGNRTAEELNQYIEDLRETITQNAYAFSEEGKKFVTNYKEDIEKSSSKCSKFIPSSERKKIK